MTVRFAVSTAITSAVKATKVKIASVDLGVLAFVLCVWSADLNSFAQSWWLADYFPRGPSGFTALMAPLR